VVYAISTAEMQRANVVHDAHAKELMTQPGVQGVGVGTSIDAPGEAALMIFLVRGVAHPAIPPVIDRLRTRVRESSRFRAGDRERRPQPWKSERLKPEQSTPKQRACVLPAKSTH
jgi:hypothetical protein